MQAKGRGGCSWEASSPQERHSPSAPEWAVPSSVCAALGRAGDKQQMKQASEEQCGQYRIVMGSKMESS